MDHSAEKFTGFIQAMLRNGGRNGVALTFGFKWSLGKADQLDTKFGWIGYLQLSSCQSAQLFLPEL